MFPCIQIIPLDALLHLPCAFIVEEGLRSQNLIIFYAYANDISMYVCRTSNSVNRFKRYLIFSAVTLNG